MDEIEEAKKKSGGSQKPVKMPMTPAAMEKMMGGGPGSGKKK